jgi:hypothetical protein
MVARTDKPISEVASRQASRADLEADLAGCIGLVGHADDVKAWIRPSGKRFRFGFYREAWALRAIDFLGETDLRPEDRAWISGLLFGYQPSQIQAYIDRQPAPKAVSNLAASG